MIKIYGIPNCDSVKKAITFFTKHNISYKFHDFKKEGLSILICKHWLTLQPASVLLHKKSTAWKLLTSVEQNQTNSNTDLINLFVQHNNLIKRPVIEYKTKLYVGYNEELYSLTFLK